MYVRTFGINHQLTKKEARTAAKFMAGVLMSSQLHNNVMIHLHFHEGYLVVNGDLCTAFVHIPGKPTPRPRRFDVYLNSKLRRKQQIMALAHELTHVKQYARGEVKDINEHLVDWKGKRVDLKKEKVPTDYWMRGWEIEANGMERALYEKYVVYLKKLKKLKRGSNGRTKTTGTK